MKIKTCLTSILSCLLICSSAVAQSLHIDATDRHQHITGFGAFVCSPSFGYNHMTTADIKKVWGKGSTVGCNIMRLYIPIGRNAWSSSLQTAKTAKELNLIVFASPWGQPAEWKTNGTINAKNSDGTTGKLKREHWADYAQYLEDYVQYLRENGVELDAISIQNEPDWPAEYAGCLWSAQEIAEFVKTYGSSISCKVIAPETLAVSDSYVNELNKSEVLPCFDIYGGHQYGGIQPGYKKLGEKGKELWMTEYLINWNENSGTTRDFDYQKDVFNFFRAINTCMTGDFNAWIHYAAKRYYGMLGDGQHGTTNGAVTKRGCVMAHFARFVTGMTRIGSTFNGASLSGSAYLSETGDTVALVLAHEGTEPVTLTVDLPFYTMGGKMYTTTKGRNMRHTTLELSEETCRPKVDIDAQSLATLLFVRSRDRQHSDMTAQSTRFDRIDDMQPTTTNFSNVYQLSGKTKTFDHDHPLISTRTSASNGYLELSDRFSELVMEVKNVSSTMNYNTSNTTLVYVNGEGKLSSHNYGEVDWSQRENFSIVLDLSPATLTDGCRGLISLTNGNWSSVLTVTFGDVYLGKTYSASLQGDYVADDSHLLDYIEDPHCTSLDLTQVGALPESLPWIGANNRVAYAASESALQGDNVVKGNTCTRLVLSETGGDFRPSKAFTAGEASLKCEVEGMRLLMLPFHATIPEGARAYTIGEDLTLQQMRSIPPHTPMLIEGEGMFTFTGSDAEVSYSPSDTESKLRGSYIQRSLYQGDYVLGQRDGQWGLVRLDEPSTLQPFGVYATMPSSSSFVALDMSTLGVSTPSGIHSPTVSYDLQGRRITTNYKGIVVTRMSDGTMRKEIRK